MNLPPGFTVTAPGGAITVTCDHCGDKLAVPYRHEPLEEWAEAHVCRVDGAGGADTAT